MATKGDEQRPMIPIGLHWSPLVSIGHHWAPLDKVVLELILWAHLYETMMLKASGFARVQVPKFPLLFRSVQCKIQDFQWIRLQKILISALWFWKLKISHTFNSEMYKTENMQKSNKFYSGSSWVSTTLVNLDCMFVPTHCQEIDQAMTYPLTYSMTDHSAIFTSHLVFWCLKIVCFGVFGRSLLGRWGKWEKVLLNWSLFCKLLRPDAFWA